MLSFNLSSESRRRVRRPRPNTRVRGAISRWRG